MKTQAVVARFGCPYVYGLRGRAETFECCMLAVAEAATEVFFMLQL